MGIKDFHQSTSHLLEEVHISKYRGQRLGCDASSWLHRGANPWGWELHAGMEPWRERGEDPPWVEFAMRMVHTVQEAGAVPVVVFDGCRNPAKAVTNQARSKSKADKRCQAEELLVAGQQEEAIKKFKQTVNVTPEMAHQLMLKLSAVGIEFMVAPYEADAQLAYLQSIPAQLGGVCAVITEDSDLVAFGTTRILFKCTQDGYAKEFTAERAFAVGNGSSMKGQVNFEGWNKEMLMLTCILSGCDYLPSLRGIGFRTAYKMVSFRKEIAGVVKEIRGCDRWTKEEVERYVQGLHAAILAFKHALVWDPSTKSCTRLHPLAQGDVEHMKTHTPELYSFIGPDITQTVAEGVACGRINPRTLEPFSISTVSECQQTESIAFQSQGTKVPLQERMTSSVSLSIMLDTAARRKLFGMLNSSEQLHVEERGEETKDGSNNIVATIVCGNGHKSADEYGKPSYAPESFGPPKRPRHSSSAAPPRQAASVSESIRKFFAPVGAKAM